MVPEVLVTGGGGGSLDGLAATLMRQFTNGGSEKNRDRTGPESPTESVPEREAALEAGAPADVVPAPAAVVEPSPGADRA